MDSRRWRRANVLVVDDQPSNLIALDAVLSADFEVLRASSGEQALVILESRKDIDVILLDVQMPGMDGFEVAARVKQLPGCNDIPIVFVTAVYNEDPFVKQGYQAGAVDYFSKPFDPEILRVKVGIYASFRQKSDLMREWNHQVQASQDLLQAGREFSAVVEHLKFGIVVMDATGRICSRCAEPIDPALDWWDANGALRAERSTAIAQVIANGEPARETVKVRGSDGTARTILCSVSQLRDAQGAPVGVVLIARDFTERNRLEADLERRIAELVSVGSEVGARARVS